MADENKNVESEELENKNADQNEGAGKSGSDKSGAADGDKSKGSEGKTFTQEQVNRMMTREKNQGRNAVYKELGIDPNDQKAVAQFKEYIVNQKTEEQKAAEQKAEESAKQAENERRIVVAEAKAEAMMMGVKKQFVEDAVALALSKMTDDNDIKTILGELKTKYPVWFGEDADDDKEEDKKGKTGQKGTGSSVKGVDKGTKKGEEGKSLGARLAAQRKSNSNKASYWGANKNK